MQHFQPGPGLRQKIGHGRAEHLLAGAVDERRSNEGARHDHTTSPSELSIAPSAAASIRPSVAARRSVIRASPSPAAGMTGWSCRAPIRYPVRYARRDAAPCHTPSPDQPGPLTPLRRIERFQAAGPRLLRHTGPRIGYFKHDALAVPHGAQHNLPALRAWHPPR